MVKPSVPPLPVEFWREALGPLTEFRKAEPWRQAPDAAVSVYVDPFGQPWFASILGANQEVFGLCLYRGTSGLRQLRALQALGPGFDATELRYSHDAVTVWYGPKGDLDSGQREIWREVGYAPKRGDRLAWPDVRSHRPGLFPWQPDEYELQALTAAIPGVLRFAELYARHPNLYDDHGELELPIVPTGGNTRGSNALEWRTWTTPPPEELAAPVAVDRNDPALQHAASLPAANESIEVDWFYMPKPVSEGSRPFYPRCLAVFRSHGGHCFGMDLLAPTDDCAAKATKLILRGVEKLGARPVRILATKADLATRLQPLAESLGAESKQVRRLGAAEEFRAGLEAQIRVGANF